MSDNGPPVRVAQETITPDEARRLLDRNTHNRKLRETRVKSLAGAMERGEWVLNGETVKIDSNGDVRDGQHRLAAVVESGVALETFVARGIAPAAQETVDTGTRRSVADMLKLRGETEPVNIASSLRYLHTYLSDRTFQAPAVAPTPQELMALLDRHPQFRDSIPPAKGVARRLKFAPSAGTALHYLFAAVDEDAADAFFSDLERGASLDEGDPVFALRRALERSRERLHQPQPWIKAAWVVKAFNARAAGRPVTGSITFRPFGQSAEAFPLIAGLDVADLDPLAR